jgi:NCAIR mutase (PurE)-related protein
MNEVQLKALLEQVHQGTCSVSAAIQTLRRLPLENLPEACLDLHREIRTGIPEIIYGEGKTSEQIVAIASVLLERKSSVMATRVTADKARQVRTQLPVFAYHPQARILSANARPVSPEQYYGKTLIICAGTSDLNVAEEAFVTLETFGHPVGKLYDAGVAGLHRLLRREQELHEAQVIIVVAGMEGALPSVVAGLVRAPVIAVPTSIGYGASFGGLAPLLGMLNSCAPGVAVVNIDNGFGAACMAEAINRQR